MNDFSIQTSLRCVYWEGIKNNGCTISNIHQETATPKWPAGGLYVGQVVLLSDLVETLLELNPLSGDGHAGGPGFVTHLCVLSTGTSFVGVGRQTLIFVQLKQNTNLCFL